MTRGVRWYLVGSLVLVALAGCGRWFAEREPWRREAEVACLKSGAVKESPAVARVKPIEGPGICGADFPLKVASLGDSALIGYAEAPRPPGAIPNATSAAMPRWPVGDTRQMPTLDAQPLPPPEPVYAPPPNVRHEPQYRPPVHSPAPPATMRSPQTVPLGPARAPHTTASAGPVEVKPTATLACPIVSALDRWVADTVQPAALRWLRQPVIEIRQISAYSCRGMNAQPGARISEHAFGNALDIAGFTLADGRRITVRDGWRGTPEEQAFLRDVHAGACNHFTTVLAPGSNAFHYDHFHVDLMRRASGRSLCQPESISGDVIAARAARERNVRPSRYATPYTGTVTPRDRTRAGRIVADDGDDWVEDEPRPGAHERR
jgi:hypothetical protein